MRIAVKYCGGCNPQIDRTGLIGCLKEGLRSKGLEAEFIADIDRTTDLILLVNGCVHACLAEEYLGSGLKTLFLSVKGEMLGDRYVKEEKIPQLLIEKIVVLK